MSAAAITRIIPFGQQLLGEVLSPGDLAVDLTAGNGHDLLFLWQKVAPTGRVFAFDIQPEALDASEKRLREAGAPVFRLAEGGSVDSDAGVYLHRGCHSDLARILQVAPRGIIANFGFLPGGDPTLITRTESSLEALEAALELLLPEGRLALTLYPGHPGGGEEATALDARLSALPPDAWRVVRFSVANVPHAPFVLVGEKRRIRGGGS